jgi:hypothetical protein
MPRKKVVRRELVIPQSPIIFSCPECRTIISGEFDLHSCCPYCGYTWGRYCRICMECRCLHIPVYRYCPICTKETKIVQNEKLICSILAGKAEAFPYYFQQRCGVPFDFFKDDYVEGAIEEDLVQRTPADELPLLIGRVKTSAGTAALEERLKAGK